jgi:hypothetical protein
MFSFSAINLKNYRKEGNRIQYIDLKDMSRDKGIHLNFTITLSNEVRMKT